MWETGSWETGSTPRWVPSAGYSPSGLFPSAGYSLSGTPRVGAPRRLLPVCSFCQKSPKRLPHNNPVPILPPPPHPVVARKHVPLPPPPLYMDPPHRMLLPILAHQLRPPVRDLRYAPTSRMLPPTLRPSGCYLSYAANQQLATAHMLPVGCYLSCAAAYPCSCHVRPPVLHSSGRQRRLWPPFLHSIYHSVASFSSSIYQKAFPGLPLHSICSFG